ncbi:MAG: cytochrome P450 [Nocardia sp.]|nr:cytochrome P450 [Nocardia sp.]
MSSATTDVHYDPYGVEFNRDPYPKLRWLREERPLDYNPEHDFYTLSRYADCDAGLIDHETFISGRGTVVELQKAKIEIPPGTLIMEDPPVHTVHRKLLSRMFTPRKIHALESKIRSFCAESLDPLVGTGKIDFIADIGAQMPGRTIGLLLGIPEEDQEAIRDFANEQLAIEDGKPMKAATEGMVTGEIFGPYIDWRVEHPSDDIMTELLNVEFLDENGVERKLSRAELLMYVNVVAGAGNETTTRLIGWAGKVLADHPDQRRMLVDNPDMIPAAIEELLRFEGPAPHICRYVARDVEYYGQTVPEGSAILFLIGAANRDHRQFGPDAELFDITRTPKPHLAFAVGTHYCLGAALARLEGRIALEEILKRFPEWEVDMSGAVLSATSTVRGFEALPATT